MESVEWRSLKKGVKNCKALEQVKNENNRKELKPTTTKETIPKRAVEYKQLGKYGKIITTEERNTM